VVVVQIDTQGPLYCAAGRRTRRETSRVASSGPGQSRRPSAEERAQPRDDIRARLPSRSCGARSRARPRSWVSAASMRKQCRRLDDDAPSGGLTSCRDRCRQGSKAHDPGDVRELGSHFYRAPPGGRPCGHPNCAQGTPADHPAAGQATEDAQILDPPVRIRSRTSISEMLRPARTSLTARPSTRGFRMRSFAHPPESHDGPPGQTRRYDGLCANVSRWWSNAMRRARLN